MLLMEEKKGDVPFSGGCHQQGGRQQVEREGTAAQVDMGAAAHRCLSHRWQEQRWQRGILVGSCWKRRLSVKKNVPKKKTTGELREEGATPPVFQCVGIPTTTTHFFLSSFNFLGFNDFGSLPTRENEK